MPSILNAPQYLTTYNVQCATAALVPPRTGITFALLCRPLHDYFRVFRLGHDQWLPRLLPYMQRQ